jgi:hypothetical protein
MIGIGRRVVNDVPEEDHGECRFAGALSEAESGSKAVHPELTRKIR